MADYILLAATVFAINVIPVFMPPTVLVLALARLNDPSFDPLTLAVVGAVASVLGKAAVVSYTKFARRFFNKKHASRTDTLKGFVEKRKWSLFAGAFIYSLSPIPSGMLFVADGLADVDPLPILCGYFIGRLLSYSSVIVLTSRLDTYISKYSHMNTVFRYLMEIAGILAAFSVILIDWKKMESALQKKSKHQP